MWFPILCISLVYIKEGFWLHLGELSNRIQIFLPKFTVYISKLFPIIAILALPIVVIVLHINRYPSLPPLAHYRVASNITYKSNSYLLYMICGHIIINFSSLKSIAKALNTRQSKTRSPRSHLNRIHHLISMNSRVPILFIDWLYNELSIHSPRPSYLSMAVRQELADLISPSG